MKLRSSIIALTTLCCCTGVAPAQTTEAPKTRAERRAERKERAMQWRDVKEWGVEGRAFGDMERSRWFDRFPAEAEGKVTPQVWELSRETTGMIVRFKTDAPAIWADYTLRKSQLAGANMTAIGASGLDLYVRDEKGTWRWAGVTRPAAKTVRQPLIEGMTRSMREYMIYLPLRNGIEELKLGLPSEAKFEAVAPRKDKPIVFYGTSITHGASASRPGMTHTAILGRRLDRPVVNLGFSGNGRMDAAVGDLLVKIDAEVYVIDCVPNMNAQAVRERCIPLVKKLRAAKPNVPILLVEDRRNTNSWLTPQRKQHHDQNHAALKECMASLQAEGITGLHYLPGDDLLGDDGEAATDGSHPSDLGFVRQADQFEPILRKILGLAK